MFGKASVIASTLTAGMVLVGTGADIVTVKDWAGAANVAGRVGRVARVEAKVDAKKNIVKGEAIGVKTAKK